MVDAPAPPIDVARVDAQVAEQLAQRESNEELLQQRDTEYEDFKRTAAPLREVFPPNATREVIPQDVDRVIEIVGKLDRLTELHEVLRLDIDDSELDPDWRRAFVIFVDTMSCDERRDRVESLVADRSLHFVRNRRSEFAKNLHVRLLNDWGRDRNNQQPGTADKPDHLTNEETRQQCHPSGDASDDAKVPEVAADRQSASLTGTPQSAILDSGSLAVGEDESPSIVPTSSDTPRKVRKRRRHNQHSIACIARYLKVRKTDPTESMTSVVNWYADENNAKASSIYRILNDHSDEWKNTT